MDRELKYKLYEELILGIAHWEHTRDLDSSDPQKLKAFDLSQEAIVARYRNDPLFHARVESLTRGIINLIEKYIEKNYEPRNTLAPTISFKDREGNPIEGTVSLEVREYQGCTDGDNSFPSVPERR